MTKGKLKMKSLKFGLAAICLLVLVLGSCQNTKETEQLGIVTASYITANSFSDLTKRVEMIVIGEVTTIGDHINIARDDKEPSTPSSTRYEIGQIYEFKVDEYLKGEGSSILAIVQVEGFISQKDAKTSDAVENAKANFNYIPIEPGRKYLLFLSDLFGFPKGQYSIGPIQPWRFDLTDPEYVIPESPWEYAKQVFLPAPLTLIIEQIKNPELDIIPAGQVGAYPIPGDRSPTDQGNSYPLPTTTP